MENETKDYQVITIEDIKTGEVIEMVVAATVSRKGYDYILVFESSEIGPGEAEATILKVVKESETDIFYEYIANGRELNEVAALFKGLNNDFTFEM